MNETTNAPSWICPAGTIVGWRDNGVVKAAGISYARAARYEVPVAEPINDGLIKATEWSPACPQVKSPGLEELFGQSLDNLHFDEHCQHLSVTAPEKAATGGSLPVMVWIHGGSYVTGAGDAPMFDPGELVREQNLIVVAVTYRLGLFGYLGSENGTAPGNLGLLDQIEALRWVKRNISAFGGNPDNITLFGQSAGGDAVAHLMIAHGTKGLFQRAIIQSAPFGILRGRGAMIDAMLDEASHIPANASVDDIIAAQELVDKRAKRFGLISSMPFGVQYGQNPLPDETDLNEAWQRAASRIEVLVGCNEREVAMFTSLVPWLTKTAAIPLVGRFVQSAVIRAVTWKVYGAGVKKFAKRQRKGGGHGYQYAISWGAPGNVFAAAHCLELPLLFGNQAAWEKSPLVEGLSWEEIHQQGKTLRQIWAGFARTGKVNITHIPGLIRTKSV